MVKSTIVGITPASHAASHIHGAADPLTGDVRIDSVAHVSTHQCGRADEAFEYVLSSTVIFDNSTQRSTALSAYTKLKEITYVGGAITLRTKYSYYQRQNAVTGYRLYINGAAQGTERLPGTGSNTWHDSEEDFAVVDGDLIQVYAKTDAALAEVAALKDFKILGTIKSKGFTVAANDP